MGRKLKPLKPEEVRSVKSPKVEARRSVVLRLMLDGTDPRAIRQYVNAAEVPDPKTGEMIPNPDYYPCSKDTLEDDRKALWPQLRTYLDGERTYMVEDSLTRMDDMYRRLMKAAQQAEKQGRPVAQVQALAAARQVIMDKNKLAGTVVDKTQLFGTIGTLNLNADVSQEEMQEIAEAVKKAGG